MGFGSDAGANDALNAQQGIFNFKRIDFLAANRNQGSVTSSDTDGAIATHLGEVAGGQPAIVIDTSRVFIQITQQRRWSFDPQIAIDDPHRGRIGIGMQPVIWLTSAAQAHGAGFSGAEGGAEVDFWQCLAQGLQQHRRHPLGAIGDDAQGAAVGLLEHPLQ